jgi:hypothetical protein
MNKAIRVKSFMSIAQEFLELIELERDECPFKEGTSKATLGLFMIRRKPNLHLEDALGDDIFERCETFLYGSRSEVLAEYIKLEKETKIITDNDLVGRQGRAKRRLETNS